MGAWGCGIFDNDDAMDWLIGWETADEGEGTTDEPGRIAFVIGAMALAVDHKGYLDSDTGAAALAAAEVVAVAGGKPSAAIKKGTDEDGSLTALAAWARSPQASLLKDPQTRSLARQAVDRALAQDSEIAELWDDTEHGTEWRAIAADLRARLE